MEKAEPGSAARSCWRPCDGDVHDIGKNLVSIIFSTNGYRVVDLGVQCPVREAHRGLAGAAGPDLIGLSGLLVRSAHQMAATAADLADAGISVPLLVGGAALSGAFTRSRIAPAYQAGVHHAADAMAGLALANSLVARGSSPAPRREESRPPVILSEAKAPDAPGEPPADQAAPRDPPPPSAARSAPQDDNSAGHPIPRAPDLARHVLHRLPLDEVFAHLNHQMLLGKHLGLKSSLKRLLAAGDVRASELVERVERLKDAAASRGWLAPAAVYSFFRAHSCGEWVIVLSPEAAPLAELPFPRQARGPRRSAADWVRPSPGDGDSVALLVVTAGAGVRERASELATAGRLLDSYALQALALETAEAAAEWLHRACVSSGASPTLSR